MHAGFQLPSIEMSLQTRAWWNGLLQGPVEETSIKCDYISNWSKYILYSHLFYTECH